MGLGLGIDGTTDFGHPELDAPVCELRQDVLHLSRRPEGSLRLSDDDPRPAASRVGELLR